jgi:hypothetical protein
LKGWIEESAIVVIQPDNNETRTIVSERKNKANTTRA